MGTANSEVGRCPECEGSIPTYSILISYENDEGEQHYAECPECEEVVHPVSNDR